MKVWLMASEKYAVSLQSCTNMSLSWCMKVEEMSILLRLISISIYQAPDFELLPIFLHMLLHFFRLCFFVCFHSSLF